MANHPRRNWRKQWTVDLEARQARHELTGAVVQFGTSPDPSGRVPPASTLLNRLEVARNLDQQHGQAAAVQMLARLVRDAADVYHRATHADRH